MDLILIWVFLAGYILIALEHTIRIEKAASALLLGVTIWAIYLLFQDVIAQPVGLDLILSDLSRSLGHIAEILFFLLGAMAIVELMDAHDGFRVVTDRIQTLSRLKLVWIIGLLSFFFSAVLDNLTTAIVMVSFSRKLIPERNDRLMFAGLIILSANAGGAWSPIGDVTTTMLWIGGQLSASGIIQSLFFPSLIAALVPIIIMSLSLKGTIQSRQDNQPNVAKEINPSTSRERNLVFFGGVLGLLFVPVFKYLTNLPPYMGMLFSLSMLWLITERIHRSKNAEAKNYLSVSGVLRRIDTPSVLFFLGILLAVSALQSAGILNQVAIAFKDYFGNIYAINLAIGLLSAVVDNVPLVAASMGMYPLTDPASGFTSEWLNFFVQDGDFWTFLAYASGTGGSILLIGSAAGVAVAGLEKLSFGWYLKKFAPMALAGYLSGALVFLLLREVF